MIGTESRTNKLPHIELIIDPEFKSLIPPLSAEEYSGLENSLIAEGCRDALIAWNSNIVDGHNRYEICRKNGIPFDVTEMEFKSRDDAIDWIYTNQLSRRNLTDTARTYLLGKQYEARKKRVGAPEGNKNRSIQLGHCDPIDRISGIIAEEQGVGEKTVRRAAEFSQSLDTIGDVVGEDVRTKILHEELPLSKKDVINLQKNDKEHVKEIITKIVSGDAKGYQDAKRQIASESVKEIEPVEGLYRVVYADPPWKYGGSMNETYGSADKHYPVLSLEDICNHEIKNHIENDAVLFLWATSPQIPEAFKVIDAWGFQYKASFVWDKQKHVMGHYNSVRHELLLVATKGSCLPENMKLYDSVVSEERSEHSKKPDTFRQIIDTLYPSGSRIELFAREKVHNWETWGNQI